MGLCTDIGRIEQARSARTVKVRSPGEIADELIAQSRTVAEAMTTLTMASLRSLLATLTARLEVDMTTKAVQIDLAIPTGIPENAQCLADQAVQRFVYHTQTRIPLESTICSYVRVARTPCFDCRRVRLAA